MVRRRIPTWAQSKERGAEVRMLSSHPGPQECRPPGQQHIALCMGLQPQLDSSVQASNALFICCTHLGTGFSSRHAKDEGPVFPVNIPGEQGDTCQDMRLGNPSRRVFEEENSTIPELEEGLEIISGNPFSVLTELGSETLMNWLESQNY